MPAPKLSKTWNISPNLRRPFTSLADATAWFLYQNKTALLAAGWTIKFTSDGVTGPTGPSDTTDRWTAISAAMIRGASAATPQSYAVLQNVDGLQLLLDFQGASDDVARIFFSPGGLYTLAGTTTHQPTATDEVIVSFGSTVVNASAGGDRVMHIWCTADTTQWCVVVARANSLVTYVGCEKVISYCGANVFTVPYVGFRHLNFNKVVNPNGGTITPAGCVTGSAANGSGFIGTIGRVFTASASRLVRVGAGFVNIAHIADTFTRTFNDVFFQNNRPALQGSASSPCYPIFWGGEKATNLDGILGSPIDWWLCHTAQTGVPAITNMLPGYDVGDTVGVSPVRTNWLVALGAECVRPWRDAAGAMLLA